MGVINKWSFWPDAYHRITSIEFHVDKKQLRIRTEAFPNKTIRDKNKNYDKTIAEERLIDEGTLINNSRKRAVGKINLINIKKHVKIFAKDNELTKDQKTKMLFEETEKAISEKMKELGKAKLDSMIDDIMKKGLFFVAYTYLKYLDEFEDAKDV